jgi:hypothetical protein
MQRPLQDRSTDDEIHSPHRLFQPSDQDMARLPDVDPTQNPEFAAVIKELEQSRGLVSNALRSIGHAPEALRRIGAVGDYARYRSSLSSRVREIVIVITGRHSRYAMNHHGPLALQAGVTQAELDSLVRGEAPATFDETDKAIVQYVLEFTSPASVSEATFARLRALVTPRELTDISVTSAYYVAFAMLLTAMGATEDSAEFVAAGAKWQQRQDHG